MTIAKFYVETQEPGESKVTVEDILEADKGLSIRYTDGTDKFLSVATGESGGGSGGGGGLSVQQVTKLEAVAPKDVLIPIPETADFRVLPVEVLKLEATPETTVYTLCQFDNGDKNDFIQNEYVEFDGTMHLKHQRFFPVQETTQMGKFVISKIVVDFNGVKIISGLEAM